MFEKGETVYYGTAGVCKVNDICRSPFDKNDERMFYVLKPNAFADGTIIYAPADNGNVLLSPLMTKKEAEDLIAEVPTLPLMEITNEKQRRDEYRNAMKNGTPEVLAMMIKTIYSRKMMCGTKKRLSDTDNEFDRVARRALFGELSVVLNVAEDEIESRINEKMK